jgi:hypothetical protein
MAAVVERDPELRYSWTPKPRHVPETAKDSNKVLQFVRDIASARCTCIDMGSASIGPDGITSRHDYTIKCLPCQAQDALR